MTATQLDHRVHDTIMNAEWRRGIGATEITHRLQENAARVVASIDRLEEAGLIEGRWENERWPNGDWAPTAHSTSTRQIRHRYYRLTREIRQTLAVRLQK